MALPHRAVSQLCQRLEGQPEPLRQPGPGYDLARRMSYHQFPERCDERLAPVRTETGGSDPISSSSESANIGTAVHDLAFRKMARHLRRGAQPQVAGTKEFAPGGSSPSLVAAQKRACRWSIPGLQRRRSARIHVDGAFTDVDRRHYPASPGRLDQFGDADHVARG